MPEREKGEKLSNFIARFIKNGRMKKKFSDIKQRLAVAYSEAKKK